MCEGAKSEVTLRRRSAPLPPSFRHDFALCLWRMCMCMRMEHAVALSHVLLLRGAHTLCHIHHTDARTIPPDVL